MAIRISHKDPSMAHDRASRLQLDARCVKAVDEIGGQGPQFFLMASMSVDLNLQRVSEDSTIDVWKVC